MGGSAERPDSDRNRRLYGRRQAKSSLAIAGIKLGRRLLFDEAELSRLIDANRESAAREPA